MTVDREQAQRAVIQLLKAFGQDPEQSVALAQTAALVVESWERDWLCGYTVDVPSLFVVATPNTLRAAPVVVVSQIAVRTLCPHHLLPAEGAATVAYAPGRQLLGLGTLARVVDAYSRRFTFQEQVGEQVTSALVAHGGALGAYCRLDMRHSCLRLRGAKQPDTSVTTTHYAGTFESPDGRQLLDIALRKESAP